jgi:hypothetical protein
MTSLKLNVAIGDPVDLSAYSPSPRSAYSRNSSNSPRLRTHRSFRFSPIIKSARSMDAEAGEFEHSRSSVVAQASESDPLIAENESKKPFYRARPLW